MRFIFVLFTILICKEVSAQSNRDSLYKHVSVLSQQYASPNTTHQLNLLKVSDYIKTNFEHYTPKVFSQRFDFGNNIYKNIIASIGPDTGYRIIVGASYDMVGNLPSADANASGVAGMIELVRTLSKIKNLPYRIDFIAFAKGVQYTSNIEQTGSYLHAKSLFENNVKVLGMINLNSIGYYSNNKKTQSYPMSYYKLLHGTKGNFISIYLKSQGGAFANVFRDFCKLYARNVRMIAFKPLSKMNTLARGDQESYQKFGYSSLKITNTAQYRNKNYLQSTDLPETLDYDKMCVVVNMVYESLKRFKL